MNSCELVSFVTAIACAISKCTPEEDLPIITAVFGQLASTLAAIAVNEKASEDRQNRSEVPQENGTQNNQNQDLESPVEVVPDTSIITVPPRTTLPKILAQENKKGM